MAELIMMVGPSHSGKSTVAKELADSLGAQIFSSDVIRGEIYGDENVQRNPAKVFEILHHRVKDCLRAGGIAIYDATNLSCKRRMAFLKSLDNEKIECVKSCVVVVCDLDTIKKRMTERERVVPWEVVHKQLCSFQVPGYYEGWDNICVRKTSSEEACAACYMEASLGCESLAHDNPHHRLNVGQHMTRAYVKADEINPAIPSEIKFAIGNHDIGKFYTKRFENGRGEPTEVAHFIGHEGYGAYMMLLVIRSGAQALQAALLVQWHMAHYLREEKGMAKLYDWLKQEGLYEYMKIMEQADKEAH